MLTYTLLSCLMLFIGGLFGYLLRYYLKILQSKKPTILHYYGIVSEIDALVEDDLIPGNKKRRNLFVATFPDFDGLQVVAPSMGHLKTAALTALEAQLTKWRYALKVPDQSDPDTFELGEGARGVFVTVLRTDERNSPDLGGHWGSRLPGFCRWESLPSHQEFFSQERKARSSIPRAKAS